MIAIVGQVLNAEQQGSGVPAGNLRLPKRVGFLFWRVDFIDTLKRLTAAFCSWYKVKPVGTIPDRLCFKIKPRTAVESLYFNLREQVGKLRSALYVPWRHPEGRGAYTLRREVQTLLK